MQTTLFSRSRIEWERISLSSVHSHSHSVGNTFTTALKLPEPFETRVANRVANRLENSKVPQSSAVVNTSSSSAIVKPNIATKNVKKVKK